MPKSRGISGGLTRGRLFDTNIKATSIDEDIFTDQTVLSTIAGDDLVLVLDVSETPDKIKYITRTNFTAGIATVTVTDNESTAENNLITFVADAATSTGSHGLEMDGDFTYNPSTGNLSATQLTGTLQTASQANITTLAGVTAMGAVANALTLTFSDATLFHDANNADTSLSMGTSAAEALKIEVLNGSSNKTAESIAFTSYTESGTGEHGKFTFSVDEADVMLTIDDGGISIAESGAYEVNGTAILSDSSGTLTLQNVDALDATTEATIEAALDTLSALTSFGAAGATTNIVAGDLTMYNAVNAGNPTISLGSGANERFVITTTYTSGAQLLDYVKFSTTEASSTADRGKFVFDVDGTDILDIDDSGINLASGKTFRENGSTVIGGVHSFSDAAIADGDSILFSDATDSNATKRDALADVATLFAGAGMTATSSVLNVIAGTGIDVTADAVAVDVSDFMSNGANNYVVTATGTDAMNAEATLQFASDILSATSSSADLPRIDITNTHAGATAGSIRFNKDSASGDDNDVMGTIDFYGTDATESTHERLAYLDAYVVDATAGGEQGGLRFYVAENAADLALGLSLVGQAEDGEVDVTVGAGAASVTTIAGTLTMGSTAAMTNAGLVSVANQSNITGVGTISSGVWQGTDVGVAHGGTGVSTLTANGALIGNGTSNVSAVDMSTKGHLLAGDGSGNPQTLSVGGTGGHVLTVDSSEATGMKWAAVSAGSATSLAATSSSANEPIVSIENTHADATAGFLKFIKNPGSGQGADSDTLGTITFYGTDASNNAIEELARMEAYIIEADDGSEAGGIKFYVAENDATMTAGLQILGVKDADGEIDVTIAAGAASTTIIAGTLTMGSTASMTNAGLLSVANQSNITGLGTVSSGTWEATDVGVAHGGTGVSTLLTNAVLTGNGASAIQAESTLLFSSSKLIPTAAAHDAAGTALTMSAGATTAGTSNNQAGGALTFQGGQGKGSGAGGDIIFQTANAAGSGSSLNSLATALTISDDLNATFADNVLLGSDSAVLSLGAGADATLTHDGTTGLTIAANPFEVDSGGNITLDSHTGIWIFQDANTEMLRITESGSGDVTIKLETNAKDLIFTDNGDAEGFRILDGAAGVTVAGSINSTLDTHYDSSPTDETVSGITATFTAGETLVRGEVVYFKAGDSKMWKAVATAVATSRCVAMAAADISADAAGKFLLYGFLGDNGTFPAYTVGATLYTPEAETSGENVPEEAQPDTDGDFVQVLGYAVTANSVFFNPSNDIIEVA